MPEIPTLNSGIASPTDPTWATKCHHRFTYKQAQNCYEYLLQLPGVSYNNNNNNNNDNHNNNNNNDNGDDEGSEPKIDVNVDIDA